MDVLREYIRARLSEGASRVYTVGEFKRHLDNSISKIIGAQAAAFATKSKIGLGTAGIVYTAEDAAKAITRLAHHVNRTGYEPPPQAYVENPILHYIDFDPRYEDVLKPELFDDFLKQFSTQLKSEYSLEDHDEMPDIDEMLWQYLKKAKGLDIRAAYGEVESAGSAYARTGGPSDLAGTPAQLPVLGSDQASQISKEVGSFVKTASDLGKAAGSAIGSLIPGIEKSEPPRLTLAQQQLAKLDRRSARAASHMFPESIIREYIREALLAEYVVPMGYSLERWLKKKEKEGISNKEYAEETKGDKWKVVHGKTRPKRKGKRKQRLRATKRGAPITKASTNLGYKRATDLHTAIKLTESSNGALREMMKRQRAIDLIVERLEGRDILNIALDVAADNPQAEFEFISDQANKFAKRADAMAQFDYLADPLGPRTKDKVEAYLKDSATEKLYAQLERLFLGQQRSDKRDYSFKGVVAAEEAHTSRYGLQGKDWESPRYLTPEDLIRLKYQESEDRTADYTPHAPTVEDIALQGPTAVAPTVDDTAALSEIYRKFGIF